MTTMEQFPFFTDSRLCLNCRNNRIPDTKIVRKNGKRWVIYQCRMCKMQDIEPAGPPVKIFKNGKFIDDTDFDENQDL